MVVMKAPPYYLMARVDLSGGSTGWHRARLIESSMEHLGEWWFAGTDYTRHWMPTGVYFSPNHVDITNHYLAMGVLGGLPLLFLFVLLLVKGFSIVGHSVRALQKRSRSMHSSAGHWVPPCSPMRPLPSQCRTSTSRSCSCTSPSPRSPGSA